MEIARQIQNPRNLFDNGAVVKMRLTENVCPLFSLGHVFLNRLSKKLCVDKARSLAVPMSTKVRCETVLYQGRLKAEFVRISKLVKTRGRLRWRGSDRSWFHVGTTATTARNGLHISDIKVEVIDI